MKTKINEDPERQTNLPHIRFLCEAYGQINNWEEIRSDVIESIVRTLGLQSSGNNYYIIGDINNLNLHKPSNFNYKEGNIEVSGKIYTSEVHVNNKYIKDFNLNIDVYIADNRTGYDQLINHSTFKNAEFKEIRYGSGKIERGCHFAIPAYMYQGSIVTRIDIFQSSLKHEFTHFYQSLLNPNLVSKEKSDSYNREYNNIYKDILQEYGKPIQMLTYALYFLIQSETNANANGLYEELRELKANRNNYKETLKKCRTYSLFSQTVQNIKIVFNNINVNWDDIRIYMQHSNYFKDNTKLLLAKDGETFKKELWNYFKILIDYAKKKYQRAIENAIGGYTEPDEQNRGKNRTGQEIIDIY